MSTFLFCGAGSAMIVFLLTGDARLISVGLVLAFAALAVGL